MIVWCPKRIQMKKFEVYNFYFDSFSIFSIRGRLQNLNFKFDKFKRSFTWQDDFKWKSCLLQSFITFRDLQLLFLLFVHPMSFKKFKFQIFKNSNVIFLDKMISKQKVINIKVPWIFEIYNLYFGHFSIRDRLKNTNFST